MDKLKVYILTFVLVLLGIAGGIVWAWGWTGLLRVVLLLSFLVLTLGLLFFTALTLYAESWKYGIILGVLTAISGYALYLSWVWKGLWVIGGIIIFFLALFAFGIWYISEPDLGLIDRFKSAKSLEKAGKYKQAARKYEKAGDYLKAAEMYIKLGWLESAAWAYEKAGKYSNAAEIYEQLYEKEKDTYYLKEAHEYWKKAGDMERAAKALERYAEEEPWFWEDVAKLYEELGNEEKVREAWEKALEYYKGEAQEEGVFWEDVGNIARKLGMEELAREAYGKFLEYCLEEAEEDPMWWKHVAEAYDYLGENEKAEEAREKYEEYRAKIMKANEETSKFPEEKKE
ncbi:lipopolysaccharide assembly protein LapB [Thermococcus sp. Bubb.Bath]|uniref:tetratricopeptide repeat protein n=1 Tax=Thermococcus sp. Bubb.Bath TaxID=1638242 RepID=UPI00143AEA93|nr:tetratricopeptide repeat protein [Thermococcus sp. Bubb.Bath]NJF25699.1 tetratricopeptide repeat protein [Thermococcus sp. Bubb.Bath]